jgi:hypothetical protein
MKPRGHRLIVCQPADIVGSEKAGVEAASERVVKLSRISLI